MTQSISEILELRRLNFERHPLVTNTIRIVTPPVKAACGEILKHLQYRESGLYFTADSRTGKSCALDITAEIAQRHFPTVVILKANAKRHKQLTTTEGTFFADLLFDCAPNLSIWGTVIQRRVRLISFLLDEASARKSDVALLLVDEAQNWHEEQLTWLRDLSNDLARQGVSLVTVLFGHPLLRDVKAQLEDERRTDLIGRFFVHERFFQPVRTHDEVKSILCSLDDAEVMDFPRDSKVSYTSFFFPRAFLAGWRLANEAGHCWDALRSGQNERFHMQFVIPMLLMHQAIRAFVLPNYELDDEGFSGSRELWDAVALMLAIRPTHLDDGNLADD